MDTVSARLLCAGLLLLAAGCGGDGATLAGGSTPTGGGFTLSGGGPILTVGGTGQASPEGYDSLANVILQVTASEGVLANDTAGSVATAGNFPTARGGAVSLRADGAFTYRPPLNFTGTDTFSYSLTSGSAALVSVVMPTRVLFVQSGAAAGGNGYQSSPFADLPAALARVSPTDILFLLSSPAGALVFSGNLPDGARLWGEGVALQTNRTLLPAGNYPRLQGQLGLGQGNDVRGIQFENPGGDAMVGQGRADGTVRDNRFTVLSGNALTLTDCTGRFEVSGNTFADEITENPREAIMVNLSGASALDLVVRSNTFTTPDRAGAFDNGLRVLGTGASKLTLLAEQNTAEVQGSGFNIQLSQAATLAATLTDNGFTRCQQEGVAVVAGTADTDTVVSTLVAQGNTFTDVLGPAFLLRARGRNTVEQTWTVKDNTVAAGGNFGIVVVRNASSIVRATLSGNQISAAAQAGIQVTSGTPSGGFTQPLNGQDHLIITNNKISGAGAAGVVLSLISQTQSCLLTGNTSASPCTMLARATSSHLGLGSNTINGPIEVTVEGGFGLIYDNQGQITPAATFVGAGVITAGAFVP